MPKVTPEHKERRRREILEAARPCFARHGYEGATVARLEEATGLSRGAIFNYFPNKEAIFLELATESSERLAQVWLEQGFRALLDAVVAEDPDWLSVQLEALRRFRTDARFRRQVEEHEAALRERQGSRLGQLQALGYRDDVPIEVVAMFMSAIANGLAMRLTTDEPMPDLDAFYELVETGVAPRRTRKKAEGWNKTTAPRTAPTRPSRRRSPAA
jgi:AcrR family transcriptional regulator